MFWQQRSPVRFGWMLLLICATTGCNNTVDGYPPNLQYPLRSDPLVITTPTNTPKEPIAAGKLDEAITALKDVGAKLLFPSEINATERDAIAQSLWDLFGSPGSPVVKLDAATELGLTSERLTEGSKLFRRHCAQCHGLSGDGRGPTGLWITPTPRDFRRAIFKFVSTPGTGPRKASRADLQRTLRHGLPGTAMPAFGMLGDETLELVIDYVRHLAIRGEVEWMLMQAALTHDWEVTAAEMAQNELVRAVDEWKSSDTQRIEPKSAEIELSDEAQLALSHQDSIRRGEQLFVAKEGAGCLACHENFGRSAQSRYDIWGTHVRPATLTEPIYKGGKRPIDLFWRVRCGIAPSGMPAVPHLDESATWDLVHFVQALPYPRLLPADVRSRVYPELSSGSAVNPTGK